MNRDAILSVFICVLGIVPLCVIGDKENNTQMESFLPKDQVGKFLAANLDLTTFRNSFGPRRSPGQRHFADFGIKPTKVTEEVVEFDLEDWRYPIAIIERGDVNGDGLEDLVIRFTDQAKLGTYASSEKLLVTRYSAIQDLIALAFSP